LKDVGWLEVGLKIPDDWELTAESGGLNEAYMRFDSTKRTKLEVKWERTKKKGEALPYIAIENFLKAVAKSSKEKLATKVIEKGNAKVAGHRAAYYLWRMKDDTFVTISWMCPDEEKLLLLQYGLDSDESKEGMFQEILKTVRCHGNENFYKYEILRVSFLVPNGFRLTKRKLLIGRVYLIFVKRDSQLYISWSGLAREQLRNYKGVGHFFLSNEKADIRNLGKGLQEFAKKVKNTDSAISLESVTKGSLPFLSKDKKNFLKVYLDEASNRIFTMAFSALPEDEQGARAFVESVKASP